MHEYSVVQALLEQIEDVAKQNDAKKVIRIVVKIGVMSGIEIHLLEIAFNTFKQDTICDGAKFVINKQPLRIKCSSCYYENDLEMVHYCCPHCGSVMSRL